MNTNGHESENEFELFVTIREDSWTIFFFAALRVRLAFKSEGIPR
jgi:hypothetical protein